MFPVCGFGRVLASPATARPHAYWIVGQIEVTLQNHLILGRCRWARGRAHEEPVIGHLGRGEGEGGVETVSAAVHHVAMAVDK